MTEAIDLRVFLPGDRPRMVALAAEARELGEQARADATETQRGMLERVPPGRFRAAADGYRPYGDALFTTEAVTALWAGLSPMSAEDLAWYRRVVLLDYLGAIDRRQPAFHVPGYLWPYVEDGLESLFEAIRSGYADVPEALFNEDVAVARLRWIPNHGSITGLSRMSLRRFAFRAPWREKLALARAFRTRFLLPRTFFVGHEWRGYRSGRQDEQPEMRTTRYVALMVANPRVAGCVHTGWMQDPALAELSPRVYQRSVHLTSIGAVQVRRPNHGKTATNALATSETRRKAAEEGRYQPQEYAVCVPRGPFVRWAEKRWGAAWGATG